MTTVNEEASLSPSVVESDDSNCWSQLEEERAITTCDEEDSDLVNKQEDEIDNNIKQYVNDVVQQLHEQYKPRDNCQIPTNNDGRKIKGHVPVHSTWSRYNKDYPQPNVRQGEKYRQWREAFGAYFHKMRQLPTLANEIIHFDLIVENLMGQMKVGKMNIKEGMNELKELDQALMNFTSTRTCLLLRPTVLLVLTKLCSLKAETSSHRSFRNLALQVFDRCRRIYRKEPFELENAPTFDDDWLEDFFKESKTEMAHGLYFHTYTLPKYKSISTKMPVRRQKRSCQNGRLRPNVKAPVKNAKPVRL